LLQARLGCAMAGAINANNPLVLPPASLAKQVDFCGQCAAIGSLKAGFMLKYRPLEIRQIPHSPYNDQDLSCFRYNHH
jgi:hypothetical protein